jgi:hypothetical protein
VTRIEELELILKRAIRRVEGQACRIAEQFDRGRLPEAGRLQKYRDAVAIRRVAYLMWHLEYYGVFPGLPRPPGRVGSYVIDCSGVQ